MEVEDSGLRARLVGVWVGESSHMFSEEANMEGEPQAHEGWEVATLRLNEDGSLEMRMDHHQALYGVPQPVNTQSATGRWELYEKSATKVLSGGVWTSKKNFAIRSTVDAGQDVFSHWASLDIDHDRPLLPGDLLSLTLQKQ